MKAACIEHRLSPKQPPARHRQTVRALSTQVQIVRVSQNGGTGITGDAVMVKEAIHVEGCTHWSVFRDPSYC
jgi:hypothetical protein